MRWSVIRRKLGRVNRAIDKVIDRAEMPGAVVFARMPKDGEVVEKLTGLRQEADLVEILNKYV